VYRLGDLKFYSKLEAIEMHAKTGVHLHWDFNEAAFLTIATIMNIVIYYTHERIWNRVTWGKDVGPQTI
jgi:hypothetical protein